MKTEFKVGLFGLLVLVILFFGIKFLKGSDIFQKENVYYATYNDVSGMLVSSNVFINGLRVGYVKEITTTNERADNFVVAFTVRSDIKIPEDSKILLFSSDLLGSKALKLQLGNSSKIISDGDTIKSDKELGMLDNLGASISPMMNNLDSILSSLNNILNIQNQNSLQNTIANIETTTARLGNITTNLDNLMSSEKTKLAKIIENTESITSNLKDNNQKLTNIIQNVDNIVDSAAKANIGSTLIETGKSIERLNSVLGVIEKGKGNVGLLINDEELYKSLDNSAKNLNKLIEDIKENPKKYINVSVF
ncbi:MAG: MCE family protein [Bacteroidales bacterium]|jgi:phospholipid/cholesterol/gamma-HCH transport system substrate-binding protein|nr:MCE family protein [Bacteroidales bacterium]MEE1271428.1 MlaD family protein [Bacteroidales bacterium]